MKLLMLFEDFVNKDFDISDENNKKSSDIKDNELKNDVDVDYNKSKIVIDIPDWDQY